MTIQDITEMPKKHRLKGVAQLIHKNPQELKDYLNNNTQVSLATLLDIPAPRLSDVLLVLKVSNNATHHLPEDE